MLSPTSPLTDFPYASLYFSPMVWRAPYRSETFRARALELLARPEYREAWEAAQA